MRCLLRAQAVDSVALTNDGSTSGATNHFRRTQLTLWIEKGCAVEWRSRNSSLQRETHSWELGCCFLRCSKKIWAVDGPAGEVSENYHCNLRESANMVAAGTLLDEVGGWESQPASDHHTGCRDVQLWKEITVVDDSLGLLFANDNGQCP